MWELVLFVLIFYLYQKSTYPKSDGAHEPNVVSTLIKLLDIILPVYFTLGRVLVSIKYILLSYDPEISRHRQKIF